MQSASISFDMHIHTRHSKHQQIIANLFPPNLCFRMLPSFFRTIILHRTVSISSSCLQNMVSLSFFLCVANCLENALVPILVSYFFKHKTTTDFLQELSNSRLCHPLKNLLYRKWWGSSNIWGHASLESDPFSTEPGLNHFLEEILRGIKRYYNRFFKLSRQETPNSV